MNVTKTISAQISKFNKSINIVSWIVFLFILFGIYVRFQDLGYSNLQGDEINPVDYIGDITGKNIPLNDFIPYLLSQKRGPMQYIINYINTGLFGYINEFYLRLPFFIFGVLAFISFYYLAKRLFNKNAALWTVLFIALNGLYIAFARITQYQSFMYLTVPISVLLYLLGFYKRNYFIIALSGLLLSINLLGHYDTLSVGPFFAGLLIAHLIRNIKDFKFVFISSIVFLIFFLIPALTFYIPFLSGNAYAESTSGYLGRRLEWSEFVPLTPLVLKILKMYMPWEAWLGTFIFIVLGILWIKDDLTKIKIFKISISEKVIKYFYVFCSVLLAVSGFLSAFYLKPRASTLLVYCSSLGIVGVLLLSKKVKSEIVGLVFWFLFAMCFYFFFMKDPRTHVYVVFIPGFVLSGYGVYKTTEWLKAKSKIIFSTFVIILFSYMLYISAFYWVVFVNKNPEYPWWDKTLFGRTLLELGRNRYEKIDGVFGFNNYRHWEEIRDLYDSGCLIGTYNSNEKNSITSFYLGFNQTNFENPELVKNADTLIIIEGPHSWYYDGLKPDEIPTNYNLLHTYYNEDFPVTFIWGDNSIYPDSKLLCK